MDAEKIRELVLAELPEAEVDCMDTAGDGQHWRVMVSSSQFEGKSILDQHRMVMAAFKDVINKELHAVEIKTISA